MIITNPFDVDRIKTLKKENDTLVDYKDLKERKHNLKSEIKSRI